MPPSNDKVGQQTSTQGLNELPPAACETQQAELRLRAGLDGSAPRLRHVLAAIHALSDPLHCTRRAPADAQRGYRYGRLSGSQGAVWVSHIPIAATSSSP